MYINVHDDAQTNGKSVLVAFFLLTTLLDTSEFVCSRLINESERAVVLERLWTLYN